MPGTGYGGMMFMFVGKCCLFWWGVPRCPKSKPITKSEPHKNARRTHLWAACALGTHVALFEAITEDNQCQIEDIGNPPDFR